MTLECDEDKAENIIKSDCMCKSFPINIFSNDIPFAFDAFVFTI